ncbi:ubiquitin-like modifier-activating enzyme 6 [Tigriopus californicus]|nr:ubiquitin-like modifier-activating enzyme 6 [Tigriopus californicus]XP_059081151.1 ubiquitin-like modifier-activating enzyme 6 [Tigriopus californicus]
MPQECLLVKKVLNEWQCTSWNDCVILARNKFEKYFNHKALQLLVNFPSDVGNSTDSNFWAYPKQEPRPVTFDPTKDSHLKFVTELAKAFARMMNIHPLEETIATDVLKKVQVRPFISKSKTFVTDDSVSKEEAKSNESTLDHDIFNDPAKRTQFIKQLKAARLKTLDVSSLDVSTKDRLVFVFSQMRCEMYGMAKPEASEIFYTANQKCPCLPSMLSTLANLVTMELYRISSAMDQEGKWPLDFIPMNYWFAGMTSEVICAPSPMAKVIHSTNDKFQWSLWSELEIQGWAGMTVQEFLDLLVEQHDLDVTMVVQGSKMIYVQALPMHAKRKIKPLCDFLKPGPNKCATLSTTIRSKQSQDDIEGPPIQLRLPMK